MLTTLLAVAVSATLLTPEEVEAAPVEDLTLKQLYGENARLDNPPTVVPSTVMIAAGGGAALGFGLLSWLAIMATDRSRGWDTLGWVFIDIITVAITAAGAIVAIIGAAMLPGRLYERDRYAQRQTAVRARISAIRTGQVQEPYAPPETQTPAAVTAVARLEDERPGFGLPIALMASGGGVALIGAYYWATASSTATSSSGVPPIAIGIGLLCAGLAMEGFGIFSLISRIQRRAEVDAHIDELRESAPPVPPSPSMDAPPPPPPPPPSVQLQTPAPVLFSYAWTF